MTEEENGAARRRIEHLANEYIRPDVWGGRRHPMDDGFYELRHALDRLRRADEVLEFLDSTRRDPYGAIRTIDQTLDDARSGLVGTYGAVVSVSAGIGTMMNGVGDLW